MTAILKVDTIQDTAGNNIINESSDTITIGASGDTIALAGTTVTGITQGITQADEWRLSANLSNNGTNTITANWERNDTNFSYIGNGMTESSGIFTFPQTGIYNIFIRGITYADNAVAYSGLYLQQTTDNSTYTTRVYAFGGNASSVGYYAGFSGSAIFDVTNTTTHKVKLIAASPSTVTFQGNTAINTTAITFVRLGDT
tara:strand:+ start:385 stop:984 length:600 start_codon:yes stop_codon:yes gene_type:complete